MKVNRTQINTVLDLILFLILLAIFFVKGEVHETLGYTLGILTTIHVVLHWKQFKVMYCKLLSTNSQRIATATIMGLLLIGIFTLPVLLPDDHGDHERHGDRPPMADFETGNSTGNNPASIYDNPESGD